MWPTAFLEPENISGKKVMVVGRDSALNPRCS